MEEREELPPANRIKREIGIGESDGDTSPHVVKNRNSIKVFENGHGCGFIMKIDSSRLQKWLLLGDKFVGVHGGQADDGQTNEWCRQGRPGYSRFVLGHGGTRVESKEKESDASDKTGNIQRLNPGRDQVRD